MERTQGRARMSSLFGAALALIGFGGFGGASAAPHPQPKSSGRNGVWTRASVGARRAHSRRRRSYENRVSEALRELRKRTRVRLLGHRESWEHAVDRGFGRHEDPEVVAKRIYGVR